MAAHSELLLIFTDSRGKNLDVYIDHPNILVKAFKGATICQIIERAEPFINRYNPAGILFIGGTCDLTTMNPTTRQISLWYATMGELLEYMIYTFREA